MGAGTHDSFWGTWAPYWGGIEDRHFGTRIAERIFPFVSTPALVVGAGQGLVVERLRARGHAAQGIDRSPQMVRQALDRRGLCLPRADATALPFRDQAFGSVVVSSGVVDYGADEQSVARVVQESLRVLRPLGSLFLSFYRLDPELERIYRRIGVIRDGTYHLGRLFDLGETVKVAPARCVHKIVEWTGASFLGSLIYWARLGIARPAVLRREQDLVERILDAAARDGIQRSDMIRAMPSCLPYRDEEAIVRLLEASGLEGIDLLRTEDCVVARHVRSEARSGPAAVPVRPTGSRDLHVRTEGVRKRYPGATRDAVRGLSIAVERGTVFGILGPNGAGKTTTLGLLCGLIEPDAGTILFGGGLSPAEARRRMGLVPHSLALYPRLSARENLSFFASLYGMSGPLERRRSEELLEALGLADRADDRVETYSSGMMRRLNLVAGLVHRPEFLLLDEPTVGIDPQSRSRIFDIVLDLKRSGVTILYTTHYMEEASRLCDRVAIMDYGSVLVEDDPRALVARLGCYRIEFDTDAQPAALAAELRALPSVTEATFAQGVLSVSARDGAAAMTLLESVQAIAARHRVVLSLRSISDPSLERVFLSLTGRSLRDQVDGQEQAR